MLGVGVRVDFIVILQKKWDHEAEKMIEIRKLVIHFILQQYMQFSDLKAERVTLNPKKYSAQHLYRYKSSSSQANDKEYHECDR